MNLFKKSTNSRIALSIAICCFTGLTYGQTAVSPSSQEGGLSLLLLAGALFGLKRITDKNRNH